MPLDKDTDYEFVEVKVSRKLDVKLSLDDLLNAVQAEADALAASAQQVPPQVTEKLNQLNQLANQLKAEVGQLGQPKQP
jgi:ABC-type transporter Mla subunit MlaD